MDLETLKNRLYRYTPDAVIITDSPAGDRGHRILYANPAHATLTGYEAEEILGRSPGALQGPGTDPATVRRIRDALRGWRPVREEILNYRKDGTPFWVDLSISPVMEEGGWPVFWVSIQRDVTESRNQRERLAQATAEMAHAAQHDGLTGLRNRRGLAQAAEMLGALCRRRGTRLALLHMDLDRFKQINDIMGHATGDAVLCIVAERLRAALRPEDAIARIGGDEFVALVPLPTPDADLDALAARLVATMRLPAEVDGRLCRFGVSIGVSVAEGPSFDLDSMMIEADLALYRAKAAGRDCARVFRHDFAEETKRRTRLGDALREALDLGRIEPFYQAQVEARTHRLVGFEALARWRCPELGLLTPDRFLPVAEELGLTHRIDAAVMERALADRAAWIAEGLDPPPVSVNIGSRRLTDEGETLLVEVERLNPAPGALRVELTEAVFLDDGSEALIERLGRLKARGIGVELDDFGTGHASIAGLLRIGPDRIKIDRGFIAAASEKPSRRRMVELLVELGGTLGIGVTAEGVHAPEHVALAEAAGCDVMQGYAFGQPESADVAKLRLSPAAGGALRRSA